MENSNEKHPDSGFNKNEMMEILSNLLSYNKYITQTIIEQLFEAIRFQTFTKDEVIYAKGSELNELSILIQGRVGMYKAVYNREINDKEEVLVQEFQRGGVMGLKNLTQAKTANEDYSYLCQGHCQIAIINQTSFETHLKRPFEQFIRDTVLFLKDIPLFNCISYNKLQQNCYYISVYSAQRGQIIYSADEPHRDFYVLLDGSVAVKKRASGFTQFLQSLGEEEQSTNTIQSGSLVENSPARTYRQTERIAKVREFHQGQYFGEIEIMQNSRRMYTLISESNSIILRFAPYMFKKLIKEDPECWNILQNQTSVKEEVIKRRTEKFQATLKLVNENNESLMKPSNILPLSQLKSAQQRVFSHKIQQSLTKISQHTLQTNPDDSISFQSKQDLQLSSLSPTNPRAFKRQDSLAKQKLNTQNSLIFQNSSTSKVLDGQPSFTSISQLSPSHAKGIGKRNFSVMPLNSLNVINENETLPVSQLQSQRQSIDEIQNSQTTIPLPEVSPINASRKKKAISFYKQQSMINPEMQNSTQTSTQGREQPIPVRARHSSMINIYSIKSSPVLPDQVSQYFMDNSNSKPSTQKQKHRLSGIKERISSQDYLETGQYSTALFNETSIEGLNGMLKNKLLAGPWSNKILQSDKTTMWEDQNAISSSINKLKLQQLQQSSLSNSLQPKVGIIDKHTENFAQNLKNVFYRVLNKKNISKENTQKGLERQVLDEGIRKYIKNNSSISNNNRQHDYLKEKRLKYNDQLANVIYGRVKNYIDKKNDEDLKSHTPRLISYKSPSQILQGGLPDWQDQFQEESTTNQTNINNSSQLRFPFSLTPLKFKHPKDLPEEKEDKEENTTSSVSPRVLNIQYRQSSDVTSSPIHIDKKLLSRLSHSPMRKQQADLSQQVYPLYLGQPNTDRTSHKQFSPKVKAIQSSRKSFQRNETPLRMDPATISLFKRHEQNLSLKNKFSLVLKNSQQTNEDSHLQSGLFKVTSFKNSHSNSVPLIQTIKYETIKNY